MAEYYLRMEGVNLANFVYDTRKIQVIRGGSLLLLDAPKWAASQFTGWQSISTGASSGLFAIAAANRTEAEQVRDDVEKMLREDPAYQHATFVVDVESGEFGRARERLITKNRWRQMQSASTDVPEGSSFAGGRPCALDGVRPGEGYGPEGKPISRSVTARRARGGTKEKRDFYVERTGNASLPEFVQDFDELSRGGPGNLNHKMAVVYFDGNGFGNIQKSHCPTMGTQQQWDRTMQERRNTLLGALLQEALRGPKKWQNGGKIPLETLLWGGDELIWVVPAWVGWRAVQLFYEETAAWKFPEDAGERLTHGGGVVFCHHNAPIHRVTRLAMDLADEAKKAVKTKVAGTGNLFAYQVLESFDHIGRDLGEFREKRRPPGCTVHDLVLNGEGMKEVVKQKMMLERLELPRRKLHELVRALLSSGKAEIAKGLVEKLEADKAVKAAVQGMEACFGKTNARWLHLLELWDYLL